MGKMTSSYLRSRADVRAWPADEAARKALQQYLEELEQSADRVVSGLGGGGLDFRGADLTGLDLIGADFIESRLSGVRLVRADLARADLICADLSGADLTECLLHKTVGRACNARGTIFHGANLDRSEFDSADLRNADLSGVTFGRAFLDTTDLRGANLAGCKFGQSYWTDLPEARLAGARVAGATGTVSGPVDISENDVPHLIDGDELRAWFASQGAPEVTVAPSSAA